MTGTQTEDSVSFGISFSEGIPPFLSPLPGRTDSRRRMGTSQALASPALALSLLAVPSPVCSGISASKSVSPVDFLWPGLLQNCPPAPASLIQINVAPLLAPAVARDAMGHGALTTGH